MKQTRSHGPFGGAGKYFTYFVSTGAALAALLVNARNLGLVSWAGSGGLVFPYHSARRITLSPRADTAFALGDTVDLAATVTDRRGSVLAGAQLQWRSEDTTVATVDSAGAVVARAPGTTRITVGLRNLTAASRVVVIQRPVRVVVLDDTALVLREGESLRLTAQALDAREHRLHYPLPEWRSADTGVAMVDSSGRVLARTAGRTTLTAALGNLSATVTLRVDLAPASIQLTAGADQRAPAGHALGDPVVVEVRSRAGLPVPGAIVHFRAQPGEGTVDPAAVTTDPAGRARVAWTLGPHPGRQWLRATVAPLDTTLDVIAEAEPVPGNTRVEVTSGPVEGEAGHALQHPVVVRVTDATGAALGDVPVAWTPLDGGRAVPSGGRTDSLGRVATRWTLGPKAGRQQLRVQVGNPRTLPPFSVTAAVSTGPPATIEVRAGQAQQGTVGRSLAHPVVVQVLDHLGNPIAGASVTAKASAGSIAEIALATDAKGLARLRWTLGARAGKQKLEVRVAGLDSVARITALAAAGPPDKLSIIELPSRPKGGTAGRVVVTVEDAHGNPVKDAKVSFGASAGTFTPRRSASDASGHATVRWTPGKQGGDQQVTARIRGGPQAEPRTVRVAPAATHSQARRRS